MSLSLLHLFEFPVRLLLDHGYGALFLWSILEGEIGLMLAGWLASIHRVFEYRETIMVAIAGASLGDLSVFLAGRLFERRALRWLRKQPGREERVRSWLARWGSWVIVFERFIYGTHIPVLLSLGMSGYPFWRFLLYDLLGIVLWAVTFVTVGYLFGQRVIELILFAQKNLLLVLLITSLFFAFLWRQKDEEK